MTLEQLKSQLLELPQDQRAILAATLLGSLPAVLDDEDEGVSEALRRSNEMDEDPSTEMTWDEVKAGIRKRS